MPLTFRAQWRFEPPQDSESILSHIPQDAIAEFIRLVNKLAPQADRWDTMEHFKRHFIESVGMTYYRSSARRFAEYDLREAANAAAGNAPLFIEAFVDACRSFEREGEDRYAPDDGRINAVLAEYNVGLEVRGDQLLVRGEEEQLVEVNVDEASMLTERSLSLIHDSLQKASARLQQGQSREAVQESLWLLETVSTAFKGVDTQSGTIEGKYFNKIVRELKNAHPGTALDLALKWAMGLHGYLSSPTGGGMRHGCDLREGVQITANEARLWCNLIRSYVTFLLSEYSRMASGS